MLERINSREFTLAANQELSLFKDKFFNTFNPDAKDPVWKALIKKLIGWQTQDHEEELMIQDSVLSKYRDFVSVSSTEAGAIQISVTHKNPKLASTYANGLMELVRKTTEDQENSSKAFRLSYLAETLADALQDMKQKQLKSMLYKIV